MADVTANAEDDAQEEGAEKQQPPRKRLRKLVVFVALPLLVLALSLGGAWLMGLLSPQGEDGASAGAPQKAVFYNLPEMTVNLSSTEQRAHYLKIEIALEVKDEDTAEAIAPYMPRVLDAFQTYLRELRTSDLEGSAAIYRLKEELLRRVNDAVYPLEVERVLFKEILVQ